MFLLKVILVVGDDVWSKTQKLFVFFGVETQVFLFIYSS